MTEKRPNVLVVVADQLRGFDLGCAGNPAVHTPHLDRFAREGFRAETAFANSPVCTPSRGTMLTGLLPIDHGAVVNDLPLGEGRTIAEDLAGAGYETGYIGKWHLDGWPRDKFTPPGPRRRGFQYWAAYNCSHDYYRLDKYYEDSPEPVIEAGYEPEIQTSLAIDFVTARRSRPFALYLSWGPPHDPYTAVPKSYLDRYAGTALPWRPNVERPGRTQLARSLDPERSLTGYYGAISALDDQFGRLMAALDGAGIAEDTIVVFTSDHGDMLWSHGYVKKQLPHEESIRVPLLVRWPGHVRPGVVSDSLVSMLDLVPTIRGLTGLPALADLPGHDFSGELRGANETSSPTSVFLMDVVQADESARQRIPEWRAVRTATHLYAETVSRVPWLLFDLVSDPYQRHNLAGRPEHASVERELAMELGGWLDRSGDVFVAGEEYLRRLGLHDAWIARERHMDRGSARRPASEKRVSPDAEAAEEAEPA